MNTVDRSVNCRSDSVRSRETAVLRVEAFVRAHLDTPVPLPALSRIAGLSERGLRNAFYSVRGMSPKRSLLAERLQGARRALISASFTPTTVTSVAADYGFYELGRFAAIYRVAFGEAPSETLRNAGRTRRTPNQASIRERAR